MQRNASPNQTSKAVRHTATGETLRLHGKTLPNTFCGKFHQPIYLPPAIIAGITGHQTRQKVDDKITVAEDIIEPAGGEDPTQVENHDYNNSHTAQSVGNGDVGFAVWDARKYSKLFSATRLA